MAAARKIEAAVFDVDGMLLDNREFIFQAYEYAFRKYNRKVPSRKAMAEQVGRPLQTAIRNLDPQGDNKALSDAHNYFLKKNVRLIKGYPGLHEMLGALKRSG